MSEIRWQKSDGRNLMTRAPDLSRRDLQPELIDQPDLDAHRHVQALEGLVRINFFSGSSAILWPPIRALLAAEPQRNWRLLDIATGAGDLPIALWNKARFLTSGLVGSSVLTHMLLRIGFGGRCP